MEAVMLLNDARLPARFWQKVQVTADGCWEWMAYRDRDGYGKYRLKRQDGTYEPLALVHRITYLRMVGPIPAGKQIDHLCRNRACCNPLHMEAVTLRENVDRGVNYIALNRAKTHCKLGHPFAGENLAFRTGKGRRYRICRTCRNAEALARFHAAKVKVSA